MERFEIDVEADEYGSIDVQGMVHFPFTQIWGRRLLKIGGIKWELDIS